MKILVITNLFPNRLEPTRATFNRQQIYHLSRLCELKVVAPIPWAPPIGNWKKLREIPLHEVIDGIDVYHPRYLVIPKIGRSIYGYLFYTSVFKDVKRIQGSFDFDLLFGTWAYPDGFATMLMARKLKKPYVIKVHGTDVNEYIKYKLRRMMIARTLKNAEKVISVSNALKEKVKDIGVPEEKIVVIPNGVDTSKFHPMDRLKARQILGLTTNDKLILFVGNLKPVKGVAYLVEAIHILRSRLDRSFKLIIIGDGELRNELEEKVKGLGLKDIVHFKGIRPHDEIPLWMNACDLLCLPSLNEGMPNVILEASACGTPVVATKVGGIPEILIDGKNGYLVPPRDPHKLADAILRTLSHRWNKDGILHAAGNLSWEDNSKRVYDVLSQAFNPKA